MAEVKDLFEVDELQQYFGYGLKICDGLEVKQPTVGDIVKMGEMNYFATVHTLTAIPSDMKAQLDMMHLDWEKVQDFELFIMLIMHMGPDATGVFFGDLDFREFNVEIIDEETRQYRLVHPNTGIVIDEVRYKAITNYLCKMHGIKKKPQVAGNEYTHKMMLEMAYEDLEIQKKKAIEPKSSLKSLISAMVNMPGFKYNLKEIMNIGFYEFMDSVARTQVIASTTALMQGMYMGNLDMKKLDKKELNFMRDIK